MDDPRAPYKQVADAIRTEIRSGALTPGAQLPPITELASRHGVAKMTVQKALDELREEGLIVSWQGRGTFVRERASQEEAADVPESRFETVMQRLDAMYEEIQRLEARLSRIEAERKAQR